jgi:hypothetical protein
MMVISQVAQRYLNQLRDGQPTHPYVKDLAAKEALFTNLSQQLSHS